MKLGSEECNKLLKNYKAKNLSEELMIELLLIPDGNDKMFADMANKICNSELSDEDIEKLDIVVTRIRDELGIS